VKTTAVFDRRRYGPQSISRMPDLLERFNKAWPVLEKATTKVTTLSREFVWNELASGRSRLWTNKESAGVTSFRDLPNGEKAVFIWLGAGNLAEIKEVLPKIERHGRARGCSRVMLQGRLGWMRAFPDYALDCVTLMKDI